MSNKAQAATEFLLLVGIGLISVTVFVIIGMYYSQEALYEERYQALTQLGFELQEELIQITTLQEGMTKNIQLPESLGRFNYEITIQEDRLVLSSANIQRNFRIPHVSGNFMKGSNTIHFDGIITITQP